VDHRQKTRNSATHPIIITDVKCVSQFNSRLKKSAKDNVPADCYIALRHIKAIVTSAWDD
jgi:predicted metal-dependent phosphoesterase TrpH